MNKMEFKTLSLASGTYWLKKAIFDKTSSQSLAMMFEIITAPYSILVGFYYIWIKRHFRSKILGTSSKKDIGLALVAIAKNEANYIREWVVYHKIIGVDRIYLYDNESNDGMVDLIKPFIDEGFVVVTKIFGQKQQLNANNDAIKRFGKHCKYMAFIDLDEMIMPLDTSKSLVEIIDNIIAFNPNAGGVAVNWCMYGSSHHDIKPIGFVCENFLWRAKIPGGSGTECIKTIAIPECIKKYKQPHYPIYKNGLFNINTQGSIVPEWKSRIENYYLLKINHYFTKSKQEWIVRHSGGHSCMGATRNLDVFKEHDNNDIYEEFPKQYSEAMRKMFIKYEFIQS